MKKVIYSVLILVFFAIGFTASDTHSSDTKISNAQSATDTAKQDSIDTIKELQTRVEEIYKDVFNYGNHEGLYDPDNAYMSSEYQKLLSEAMENSDGVVLDCDHWSQSQDPLKPFMKILSVTKESSTEAIVNILITDSAYQWEGEYYEKPVKLKLIKEGGTWLVDDFITQYEGQESSEKAYLKQTISENKRAKVYEEYERLEARRKRKVRDYQETLAFNAKCLMMAGYIPSSSTNELAKYMNDIMDICNKEVELAESAHDTELLQKAKATREQMLKLVN